MASKKTAKMENETATKIESEPRKAAKRTTVPRTLRKRAPLPTKAATKPARTTPDAVKQELAKSGGPVSISVLANALGVTIPTAKRHLKALGAAVKSEGTTRDRVYSLAAV